MAINNRTTHKRYVFKTWTPSGRSLVAAEDSPPSCGKTIRRTAPVDLRAEDDRHRCCSGPNVLQGKRRATAVFTVALDRPERLSAQVWRALLIPFGAAICGRIAADWKPAAVPGQCGNGRTNLDHHAVPPRDRSHQKLTGLPAAQVPAALLERATAGVSDAGFLRLFDGDHHRRDDRHAGSRFARRSASISALPLPRFELRRQMPSVGCLNFVPIFCRLSCRSPGIAPASAGSPASRCYITGCILAVGG